MSITPIQPSMRWTGHWKTFTYLPLEFSCKRHHIVFWLAKEHFHSWQMLSRLYQHTWSKLMNFSWWTRRWQAHFRCKVCVIAPNAPTETLVEELKTYSSETLNVVLLNTMKYNSSGFHPLLPFRHSQAHILCHSFMFHSINCLSMWYLIQSLNLDADVIPPADPCSAEWRLLPVRKSWSHPASTHEERISGESLLSETIYTKTCVHYE